MEVIFRGSDGMLLKKPAIFGNHTGSRFKRRRRRIVAADSFAESRYSKQIVAYGAPRLAEVVQDARLRFLGRVCGEHWTHAESQLVLAPESERIFLIGEVAGIDHSR